MTGYRPQFFLRTTDVTGTATLKAGVEMIMPGDNAKIDVELIYPVAMEEGLRFAIREGGRTVGAGVVTKILQILFYYLLLRPAALRGGELNCKKNVLLLYTISMAEKTLQKTKLRIKLKSYDIKMLESSVGKVVGLLIKSGAVIK